MPKINHLLCTVPPGKADQQLHIFDQRLRNNFELITHTLVSDAAWCQASPPVKLDGVGLQVSSCTSAAAFIGSCNLSRRDVNRQLCQYSAVSSGTDCMIQDTSTEVIVSALSDGEVVAKESFITSFGVPNAACLMDRASQRQLQLHLNSCFLDSLKACSSVRNQARLNTIATPHAGALLKEVPNPQCGLTMSRYEFTVAICLLLSVFQCFHPIPRCLCSHHLDPFGDHMIGCGHNHQMLKCHNDLMSLPKLR